jgi:hypothetical protein
VQEELSLSLSLSLLLICAVLLPTPTAADAATPTILNSIDITIAAPKVKETPATTATCDPAIGITGIEVSWGTKDDGGQAPEKFKGVKEYTVSIDLTAGDGYKFPDSGFNFKVNGAAASAKNDGTTGKVLIVSKTFPKTASWDIDSPVIITGITPVSGDKPQWSISATEYTGTIGWRDISPVSASQAVSFDVDHVYSADIILIANADDGYGFVSTTYYAPSYVIQIDDTTYTPTAGPYFNGKKRLSFDVTFPKTEGNKMVDDMNITGVTAPVAGATPVASFTDTQYTGTVVWSPDDATFKSEQSYTATITLSPKHGYKFDPTVEAPDFKVPGATASAKFNANKVSMDVTAIFPKTGSEKPVDISAVPMARPEACVQPVRTFSNSQYSGSVTWSPEVTPSDNTFKGETHYYATINLTAATGYTFNGLPANFFTVGGYTATGSYNGSTATLTVNSFPDTGADTTVTTKAIPGVTVPATGATPDVSTTTTTDYYGAITWTPDDTTFQPNTVYTAHIKLTPKGGWTLNGVAANVFTVAGTSTPATNAANSGDVTAEFPATSSTVALVVNIPNIQGVTPPVVGATPVRDISPTTEYEGTVTWYPSDSPFKPGIAYTATIDLTTLGGYTLSGVSENYFKVAGATATNAADSGVVKAVFPSTPDAAAERGTLTNTERTALEKVIGEEIALVPTSTSLGPTTMPATEIDDIADDYNAQHSTNLKRVGMKSGAPQVKVTLPGDYSENAYVLPLTFEFTLTASELKSVNIDSTGYSSTPKVIDIRNSKLRVYKQQLQGKGELQPFTNYVGNAVTAVRNSDSSMTFTLRYVVSNAPGEPDLAGDIPVLFDGATNSTLEDPILLFTEDAKSDGDGGGGCAAVSLSLPLLLALLALPLSKRR